MNFSPYLLYFSLLLFILAFFCLSQIQVIREIRASIIDLLSINFKTSNKKIPISTGITTYAPSGLQYSPTERFSPMSPSQISDSVRMLTSVQEILQTDHSNILFKANLAEKIKTQFKKAQESEKTAEKHTETTTAKLAINQRVQSDTIYSINPTKPEPKKYQPPAVTEEKKENTEQAAEESAATAKPAIGKGLSKGIGGGIGGKPAMGGLSGIKKTGLTPSSTPSKAPAFGKLSIGAK